jgi:hypothetical protein
VAVFFQVFQVRKGGRKREKGRELIGVFEITYLYFSEVKSARTRMFADVNNSRLDSGKFRLKSTKVPEMGTVRMFVMVWQPMNFKDHSARFSGSHAVIRKQVQSAFWALL